MVLMIFLKLLKPDSATMVFYTKKKVSMWILMWIQKITLTNILKWILFLQFFFYQWIILYLNSCYPASDTQFLKCLVIWKIILNGNQIWLTRETINYKEKDNMWLIKSSPFSFLCISLSCCVSMGMLGKVEETDIIILYIWAISYMVSLL